MPMVYSEWERRLRGHPDRAFMVYLVGGIKEGFRVGFRYGLAKCYPVKGNMKSAVDNPEVVDEYLVKEVGLGKIWGPFQPEQYAGIQINTFRVIPKNHHPGKWRLIVDLSHPRNECQRWDRARSVFLL